MFLLKTETVFYGINGLCNSEFSNSKHWSFSSIELTAGRNFSDFFFVLLCSSSNKSNYCTSNECSHGSNTMEIDLKIKVENRPTGS